MMFTDSEAEALDRYEEHLLALDEGLATAYYDRLFRRMLSMKGREMWVVRDNTNGAPTKLHGEEPVEVGVGYWHPAKENNYLELEPDAFPDLIISKKMKAFLIGVEDD